MNFILQLEKYSQEGDMSNTYHALRNILDTDGSIKDFRTDQLEIDLNNPLNIECQPSYDGTVNLIINDDKNPPRIINTRFSVIEDGKYKIINRNQIKQTNLYEKDKVDAQTRLFRNLNIYPKIDLVDVKNGGNLWGGNYTFYIKLADSDYNKTDIVAESSIVSVFKGTIGEPKTISGTILDERTDKTITLKISDIDTSFSKLYVYFTRDTCTADGLRFTKNYAILDPYDLSGTEMNITFNGYEQIEEISTDSLNIQYNMVSSVKTHTQVQNRLFFGNVDSPKVDSKELQNISYFVKVTLKQKSDSIGYLNEKYEVTGEDDKAENIEYYSPQNIYYNLGYWPEEIYRLGIVYIMNDDSLSPVFNLRGCEFTNIGNDNSNLPNSDKIFDVTEGYYYNNEFYEDSEHLHKIEKQSDHYYKDRSSNKSCVYYIYKGGINKFVAQYPEEKQVPKNSMNIDSQTLSNSYGIFKNPQVSVICKNNGEYNVKPLYYEIELSDDVLRLLKHAGVKAYFIVRQKRIANILCQGLTVGVDRNAHVPSIYHDGYYYTQSFLNRDMLLVNQPDSQMISTGIKACSGLLAPETIFDPVLASNFLGNNFYLSAAGSLKSNKDRNHFYYTHENSQYGHVSAGIVHVPENTPLIYINGQKYSTQCGVAEDVSQFSFFDRREYAQYNQNLLRGLYTSFLGVSESLLNNCIYNIKIPNYSDDSATLENYFKVRKDDNSPFYAISNRINLKINDNFKSTKLDVYRGDCYTCTSTIRIIRNFVDPEVPTADSIVDPYTWINNYKGFLQTDKSGADGIGNYLAMNRADINTVQLGLWVTFKYLASSNLGLRCEDKSHTDETALLGNHRSFYPVSSIGASVTKTPDSTLFNNGYGSTVGQRMNFALRDVPYTKELFDNRIMFSNIQKNDDFQNSYRVFQGLSYQDLDRQYGAIVKFIPWKTHILCIFEHGIGIIPINEKALISTTTGQDIHMYGSNVIQNQISLISDEYGSIWPESIVKTPKGIYGVDTYAKKIWRIKEVRQGLSTIPSLENISDMKVQQYLNDHLLLKESDKYPIVALRNVKTHYNDYKGDLMFTFYNDRENETWNLCYNERMDRWITRYTWTPLYSENINNIFYSLDQNRAKVYGYIYNNQNREYGLRVGNGENQWKLSEGNHIMELSLINGLSGTTFVVTPSSVESEYITEDGNKVNINWTKENDLNWISFSNNKLTFDKTALEDMIATKEIPGIPAWFKINIEIKYNYGGGKESSDSDIIGLVVDYEHPDEYFENLQINTYLRNGFFVHGRAGIFNEINYTDPDSTNRILPTKWYNKQEPFEFEFVVKDPIGLHKIFDNLVIISNNVEPKTIEYEIIGDVYNFDKENIFKYQEKTSEEEPKQELKNCRVAWDATLNTYSLIMRQDCKNIKDSKYGRLLGNIHYKEDSWYLTIDPIKFKNKDGNQINSTRVRDKWVKIRIRYSGEDLVVITAIKTLFNV